MPQARDSETLVITITSVTRWDETSRANIDRLIRCSGSRVQPMVVNKIGATLSSYIEAVDLQHKLKVVDTAWDAGYNTWAQFEAPPRTWTICLHDDDSWTGPLVPSTILADSRSHELVLPAMFTPLGEGSVDNTNAQFLARRSPGSSPKVKMSDMARHPFPVMFAYTPAVAWNCWREFIASRPIHLPHMDWQLNFAAAALATRICRAELAYVRDSSTWSDRCTSQLTLARMYGDIGLSPQTAQLDSLLSDLHTLALTGYLPITSTGREQATEFALAKIRDRSRRLARLLRFLPTSVGRFVSQRAYAQGMFSVDLEHHSHLSQFYLGRVSVRSVEDVRERLLPVLRTCDPSDSWRAILGQLDRDLADLT